MTQPAPSVARQLVSGFVAVAVVAWVLFNVMQSDKARSSQRPAEAVVPATAADRQAYADKLQAGLEGMQGLAVDGRKILSHPEPARAMRTLDFVQSQYEGVLQHSVPLALKGDRGAVELDVGLRGAAVIYGAGIERAKDYLRSGDEADLAAMERHFEAARVKAEDVRRAIAAWRAQASSAAR